MISSIRAMAIEPSLTWRWGPYMIPPFSSPPNMMPWSTMTREITTLPTLVLTTLPPAAVTTSSRTFDEFTAETTLSPGFLAMKSFASRATDLSPHWTSPFSSTNMERSPSPSKAMPRSAPEALTSLFKPSRLSGRGSESLPGNLPFTLTFTV